jgi:hypothetical protein
LLNEPCCIERRPTWQHRHNMEWNPWGFHNTVSSHDAFPRRKGSVRHFPCILVPRPPYPSANVFVIERSLALVPGDEIVPIVVGVRTEPGK